MEIVHNGHRYVERANYSISSSKEIAIVTITQRAEKKSMKEMSNSTATKFSVVVLLGVLALGGCQTDRGTVTAKGKVTLDGEPVEGASVAFSPADGSGQAAAGTTNAAGEFELTTFESGDGAMPGSYKVSIVKTKGDAGAAAAAGGGGSSADIDALYQQAEAAGENVTGNVGNQPTPETTEYITPEKYASTETSGLTATVSSNAQENTFNFELTSSE